jgi:type IV secretion system protein VirB3
MSDGFNLPLHRSLTEPILMAGAPRSAAIGIGTLAAALIFGLQLFIPGLILWVLGHSAAVFAAKADPDFMTVTARHIRQKGHFAC